MSEASDVSGYPAADGEERGRKRGKKGDEGKEGFILRAIGKQGGSEGKGNDGARKGQKIPMSPTTKGKQMGRKQG